MSPTGAASAATATSVSRTRAGSARNRSATRALKLSGSATSAPSTRIASLGDRAPELEREERVSTRDLVHAHQLRSRQVERRADPRAADGSRRPRAARPRSRRNPANARSSSSGTSTGRPRTVARTPTGSPSSRRSMNREHLGRAGIDPLHVVERDKKRPVRGKRAYDREQREPEQAHLRGGPSGSRISNAVSSARRCTGATAAAASPAPARTDRRRSRTRSASPTGSSATVKTRKPRSRASRSASCQSAVLPIPASPSSSNACPPAGTAARNASSASSSSRLPMISTAIAPPALRPRPHAPTTPRAYASVSRIVDPGGALGNPRHR